MVDDPFDDPEAELGEDAPEAEDAAQDEVLKLVAENAGLKEQALRSAADAETTKRRAERESTDARAYPIQNFAPDRLDAADSLASAVEHAPKGSGDPAVNNLVTGVEMTEKALQTAFERNGLKRVNPAKGEKFDPNLHQAMMEQPVPDVAPGSVVQVMQTGYELLGRLVRPAMVIVTPKAAAPSAATVAAETKAYAQANGADTGGSVDQKA